MAHQRRPYGPTPLNYAQPATVTRDQVQDMIGQAMESFTECQRQENEKFRLSMQNVITMQFSNLSAILLHQLLLHLLLHLNHPPYLPFLNLHHNPWLRYHHHLLRPLYHLPNLHYHRHLKTDDDDNIEENKRLSWNIPLKVAFRADKKHMT
ncbi:hypothetical protein GmHk_05G012742 [Glycine max]|nr:hypothetical protein GmHk_05G012742 [Glycine max]